MKFFVPVDSIQVKACQLCGSKILFVERRQGGLWFPTDAVQDEETQSWGYLSRGSAKKEVALLHLCFGDPGDLTTVNGKRAECKQRMEAVQKQMDNLHRSSQIILGNEVVTPIVRDTPEYNVLMDEYLKIKGDYPEFFGQRN